MNCYPNKIKPVTRPAPFYLIFLLRAGRVQVLLAALLIILVGRMGGISPSFAQTGDGQGVTPPADTIAQQRAFQELLDAMIIVESGGDPNCEPGDGGRAVGVLQIHKIYVREANRILGEQRYSYTDRKSVRKSRKMADIYLHYWVTEERLGREPTLQDYARTHNGNPVTGWKQKATLPYWYDVKEVLQENH